MNEYIEFPFIDASSREKRLQFTNDIGSIEMCILLFYNMSIRLTLPERTRGKCVCMCFIWCAASFMIFFVYVSGLPWGWMEGDLSHIEIDLKPYFSPSIEHNVKYLNYHQIRIKWNQTVVFNDFRFVKRKISRETYIESVCVIRVKFSISTCTGYTNFPNY